MHHKRRKPKRRANHMHTCYVDKVSHKRDWRDNCPKTNVRFKAKQRIIKDLNEHYPFG